MGYPAFNKIAIQLPLPSATMTKAKYKEAYGIDLDELDFAKITLLVDGNEKYAVDEIKIVSDDVLILAGGKILTIGDDGNVSVVSSAYSVENAKPIYYHPISFYSSTNTKGILSLIILDNSPVAYTKETLIAKIANFNRITPLVGSIYLSSGVILCSFAYKSGDKHYFYGWDKTNDTIITSQDIGFSLEDFLDQSSVSLNDDVNKIN